MRLSFIRIHIHSMVAYRWFHHCTAGGSRLRIPIQLALTWPERRDNSFGRVDFTKVAALTFEKPDFEVFRCLKLAFRAAETGGSLPVVMNAANEVAVSLFLQEKIPFVGIMDLIETVMGNHLVHTKPSIDDIIETDAWSREETLRLFDA